MALTKDTLIDKVEILRNGVIQVREVTEVFDDTELLGQRYHRRVFDPLTPLADVPGAKLRAICELVWTPAVQAAYLASLPVANEGEPLNVSRK
jgi:hypothetical protein